MSSSRCKRYRVCLDIGRDGVEMEIIVSAWEEEYIRTSIEYLFGDKVYMFNYEEIGYEDNE